jgi:hypothetical protein
MVRRVRARWLRSDEGSAARCRRGSSKRRNPTIAAAANGKVTKLVVRAEVASASTPPASALTTNAPLSTIRTRPIQVS